jgi:hypothetical protein
MDKLRELDILWGYTLYNIKIDLLLQRICLFIKAPYSKTLEFYQLTCFQFTGLHYFDERDIEYTWPYIEITEVYIVKEKEHYNIKFILWGEESPLYIICKDFRLEHLFTEKKDEKKFYYD